MRSRQRVFLLLALTGVLLGGCVRVDIGGDRKPTLGQQMIDLYQARQSGAIDDAQYKRMQLKILSNGT